MTRWRPVGDAALLLQAEGRAARLAAAILAERLSGVVDVVPGAGTVLVATQPGALDLASLAARLLALPLPPPTRAEDALTEIPVVYDGPDLAEVARLTGLSAGEVVARHAAAEYTVGWLGFSPGFGYLTGLDPLLATVPRLAEPRLRVPAGAVAIAGGLAAVYPASSPGGWRLLGRTPAVLWDPDRDPPAVLAPGMRVRFRDIGPGISATPAQAVTPATRHRGEFHDRGSWAADAAGNQPRSWKTGLAIEVIRPGLLATVQDLGRPGFGHLGVPRSGAADPASLRLANRLAGNPGGAAGIEVTFGRAAFRFTAEAWVAVAGAPVPVSLESGREAAAARVPHGSTVRVPAGAVVRLGAPQTGLRSYLAVRGGVDMPPVLGSRSADLRSGLGPAPLRPGDLLPVAPAGQRPGTAPGTSAGTRPPAMPVPGEPTVLRVVPGPRDDWFAPGAVRRLCADTFLVTPASDRAGLRLDGPAVQRARGGELLSEGMATGSLQVPPNGKPILLLAEHPVTGGYPVIATVVSADTGLAAQLRPGGKVRFALASRP
jgi:KipI family sensor histidine kinase inhibitor